MTRAYGIFVGDHWLGADTRFRKGLAIALFNNLGSCFRSHGCGLLASSAEASVSILGPSVLSPFEHRLVADVITSICWPLTSFIVGTSPLELKILLETKF